MQPFPVGNIDSTPGTSLALIDQRGRPERGPCIIRQGYASVSLHWPEVHWRVIRDRMSGDRFVPGRVLLSGDTFRKVNQCGRRNNNRHLQPSCVSIIRHDQVFRCVRCGKTTQDGMPDPIG